MKKKVFIGLVATLSFGVFNTVHAENYIASSAPEKFTTRGVGRINLNNPSHIDYTRDAGMHNSNIEQNIFDYHANEATGGYKVFCYDRNKQYAPAQEYKLKGEVNDPGIAYIIAHAEAFYKQNFYNDAAAFVKDGTTYELVENVRALEQSWLTQVAIWKYLEPESTFATQAGINPDLYENIAEDGRKIKFDDNTEYFYSQRASTMWSRVNQLVEQAKNYKGNTEDAKIAFDFDKTYQLDKDNKVIKTGLIKASQVENGTIDFSKLPRGTKVYDKDGKEIKTDENMINEFYLVIPVENIDNYSFDFDITASGEVDGGYKAYEYVRSDGADTQPLVLATSVKKPVTGSLHLETSHIEDTSSIIATSIYFIGFMVLLAGLGVIYINVRPKKAQI